MVLSQFGQSFGVVHHDRDRDGESDDESDGDGNGGRD